MTANHVEAPDGIRTRAAHHGSARLAAPSRTRRTGVRCAASARASLRPRWMRRTLWAAAIGVGIVLLALPALWWRLSQRADRASTWRRRG